MGSSVLSGGGYLSIMKNSVLTKFQNHEKSIGTFASLNSPIAAECLSYTGLDYVVIDMEHTPVDIESATTQMSVAQSRRLTALVRVNAISPGWIDTNYTVYEGPDATQQPAGRVGNPLDIAHMALYLCSDKAGFITGENICIDGGMTRQMIYHNDFGWTLQGGRHP